MTHRVISATRAPQRILILTSLVLALLTPAMPGFAVLPAAVSGQVTDIDSHVGIDDVNVWVYDSEFNDVADLLTNADGSYNISSLPGNGTYYVDFYKEGYSYDSREVNYTGSPLTLNVELQALTLVATGTVTSSEGGLPVADAWISVMSSTDFDGFYAFAMTDSEGHYAIYDEADAGADTLEFYVEADGFRPTEDTATWNGSDVLTMDFVLEPAPVIVQGNVTDAKTGKPVPDAWVWAGRGEGWDYEDIGYGMTDENGDYTLFDMYDAGAGTFTVGVEAEGYESVEAQLNWNGVSVLTKDFQLRPLFPWTGDVEVVPIEGDNRYVTAVQGSRMAFPESGSCSAVVLASGENFPDALGGSALAGALDCPVLLTKPGQLSSATAAEIARLGAKTAWVIGGTAAVSDSVLTSLKNMNVTPRRIAGSTRYQTAALVAEKTVDVLGPRYTGDVMIATGENFPDALAAAPLATYAGVPILLVKTNSIPAPTQSALDTIFPWRAIVLGGDKVVGTTVFNSLKKDFGAEGVERLAGNDRYATACVIAEFGVEEYGLSWGGTGFATGATFPDALAGGAAQGITSTVMLLTKSDSVPAVVSSTIESYGSKMNELHFYGGTAAISTSVRSQITNHVKAMHLP